MIVGGIHEYTANDVFHRGRRTPEYFRAAQSLFITQQTTQSAHVAAMEKELGTCLFERRPKSRLTSRSGERFLYQYCLRFPGTELCHGAGVL